MVRNASVAPCRDYDETLPFQFQNLHCALKRRLKLAANCLQKRTLRLIQVAGLDANKLPVRSDSEGDAALTALGVDHSAEALKTLTLKAERPFSLEDLGFGLANKVLSHGSSRSV